MLRVYRVAHLHFLTLGRHLRHCGRRRLENRPCLPQLKRQWGPSPAGGLRLAASPVCCTSQRRHLAPAGNRCAAHADRLWRTRRELFFKLAAGFGSKAAYRGDKLTRRVWDEIIAGAGDAGIDGAGGVGGVGATKVSYVAQALARPSERVVGSTEAAQPPRTLKLDLRNYTYAGRVILTAARTWQGQTTNFRTPGGGFAPVFTETAALAETAGRVCGADCGAAAVSGASPAAVSGASPAAVPCAVPAVVPAPVSAAASDTAPMSSA